MKYKQSSFSLHSKPKNILTLQSSNFPINYHLQSKPQFLINKQYTNLSNARGRLKKMAQEMNVLQDQSRSADQLNKELHLKINFLKDEYLDHGLSDLNFGLLTLVKQLKKKITIKVRTDLLKYESIKNIYGSLNTSHKQLANKIRQIQERVQLLQNVVGVEPNIVFFQNT